MSSPRTAHDPDHRTPPGGSDASSGAADGGSLSSLVARSG
jgi:hypothetical protein